MVVVVTSEDEGGGGGVRKEVLEFLAKPEPLVETT